MVMNEREKGVASLGLALVEVAQGDPFRRVTQSKPFEELREELNRMKASMSGVDQEDLIPCDLIQEETSTLTASVLNLLQSRWSDIVEMEGSEEAVVDRFKYIPDSLFLARARNLVSKLNALPMAGSVHSHGVGGGMVDSKVYTPIGGRSGLGGRGGRGGRGQNPVALNLKLNVVSVVDNAAPDKSWASISDLSRSVFLICDMFAVARIINATLVIPKLDKRSFCSFSDVFDQDHFISSLANGVKVIRKLPKELENATRAG
ncbi:O-fucosyltransferase 7 [Camellia lanceoleosa]|uniref:O-fucosyltransferase 7 n=1 Tax=Camellia lanceoleosa TaxID=1840588 RepID=A0ACC0HQL5_9ERIC|nr:O-fucosyltransferase 7 [Camellia lanceoleosa]